MNDVLTVIRDTGAGTISAPHTVRLANGEIWCCNIQGADSDALAVRGDLFGEGTVGLDAVASLDFSRCFDPAAAGRRGFLYREKGEPIPGSIMWIREGVIAIDCPLGVLPVPREGVVRYVLREPSGLLPVDGEDEIGLIDGSIFRGRLGLSTNGAEVTHRALGALPVPWAAVRHLMRSPPGLTRLGLPDAGEVAVRGPAGPVAPPRLVDYRSGFEPGRPAQRCLTALRMQPVTVARYRLPRREGKEAEFRAVAALVPGARSGVRIGLSVSGARVYEKTLSPSNASAEVSIELPAGDELAVEADFDGRFLYPCGVDWQDPCVLLRKEEGR
ncbi:MAG: hypothetical protein FJ225_08850 [Lentisphaerae bacterium]|nr:hypothetical protein [Lentisphaerota bacterium]